MVETGLNRLHFWGLIVPLLVFPVLPYVMANAGLYFKSLPQPVNAIVFGMVAAVTSYLLMTHISIFHDAPVLERSIILGLLVAKFTIFEPVDFVPSVTMITFYLFIYFYAAAEVDANANWLNAVEGHHIKALETSSLEHFFGEK
jgi:hypothetical protein